MDCPKCSHRSHGRVCNKIIDNGWNWHGCHCDYSAVVSQPVWLRRMAENKAKDMTGPGPDAA